MNEKVITGVYFLKKENKVVYVGQSVNINRRVEEHKKTKDFDSFDFVECDKDLLDCTENSFIMYYSPTLNIKKAEINTNSKIIKKYNNDKDKNCFFVKMNPILSVEFDNLAKELNMRRPELINFLIKFYKEKR